MNATPRLLIAYAHPDDESFGLGGLIAKYVARGVEVDLICATNGDVGTIAPEMMNGHATIADVRLAELDCAAAKLGLHEVIKLGYKDSGMMGSPDNAASSSLWSAPVADVTRRVVEVIRRTQPQVVITFNKYGGYGHPDHIAIQRATTQAFTLAGDSTYATGQAPYRPQKLYYSNILKRMLQVNILRLRAQRKDPRRLGRNQDIDMMAILDHCEPIHAAINISAYHEAWDEASACHASQLGGGFPRLPMRLRKRLLPWQGFTRVYPAPKHNRLDERDLFAGVTLDTPVTA
ncbi:MAG: PIG-L family deacetylase [Chloroflexota bacterium]|nr:PIG-L family deacetylase [Chloroflexota bacterium]